MQPLRPDLPVEVWCVDLEEAPLTVDAALAVLCDEERRRVSRFRFPLERQRYVIRRGILRTVVGKLCGVAPNALIFEYNKYGKPFVAGNEWLQFSVSQSEHIAAYTVGIGCEVGIDIERIRPIPEMNAIAQKYFSDEEYSEFMNAEESERPLMFYRLWVEKEACLKAIGCGFSDPSAVCEPAARRDLSIYKFSPNDEYCGAVAIRPRQTSVR